jgi:DNA polymerase-3 subunit alpha
MAVLNDAMEIGHDKQKERAAGQLNIFQTTGSSALSHELPDIEEWSEEQILKFEKDTIGTYVTGHPLRQYTDEIGKYITADSSSLHELPDGKEACIGGIPAALKEITTRKGDRMGFLTLEDLKGSVEVVVFSDIYQKSSHCLREDAPIIVRGKTNRAEDKSKIIAMDIVPLSEARYKLARSVHIKISDSPSFLQNLEKLRDIILSHRGKSKTILHLIVPERSETIISLLMLIAMGGVLAYLYYKFRKKG